MKFSFSIPEDLQKQLSKAADFDKIAPKMINAATPKIVTAIKKRLAPHSRTNALVNSVKAKPAKQFKKGGWYGQVLFDGYDTSRKTKVANAQKAIALEYGTKKQQAKPFMKAAIKDCEKETVETMQKAYNMSLARNGFKNEDFF